MNRFTQRLKNRNAIPEGLPENATFPKDESVPVEDLNFKTKRYSYDEEQFDLLAPQVEAAGFKLPEDPNSPEFDELIKELRSKNLQLATAVAGMRRDQNLEVSDTLLEEAEKKALAQGQLLRRLKAPFYTVNAAGQERLNKNAFGAAALLLGALLLGGALTYNPHPQKVVQGPKIIGSPVSNADGSQTTSYSDGTTVTKYPDGTVSTLNSKGETTTVAPDGTTTITYPDKRKVVTKADKTSVEYLTDGSTISRDAQGHVTGTTPSGQTPSSVTSSAAGAMGINTGKNPNATPTNGIKPENNSSTVVSNTPSNTLQGQENTNPYASTSPNNTPTTTTTNTPTSNPYATTSPQQPTTITHSYSSTPNYTTSNPTSKTSASTSTPGLTTTNLNSVPKTSSTSTPASSTASKTVTPGSSTTSTNGKTSDPQWAFLGGNSQPGSQTTTTPASTTTGGNPTYSNQLQNPATVAPETHLTVLRTGQQNSTSGTGSTASNPNGESGQNNTQSNQTGSANSPDGKTNGAGVVVYQRPAPQPTAVIRAASTSGENAGQNAQSAGNSMYIYRKNTQTQTTTAQNTDAQTSAAFAPESNATTNPQNPAQTTTQATTPPAPVSPYRTGQTMNAALTTGVYVAQGGSSLPVYAKTQDGTIWRGEISLDATKRVNVIFDHIILKDGTEMDIQASAYHLDGTPGLPAKYREISPTLANDLIRASLTGVNNYVNDILQATTTTTTPNGSQVVERSTPTIGQAIAGSATSVFQLPPNQNTFVTVAEIPVGTAFAMIYGPVKLKTDNQQQ